MKCPSVVVQGAKALVWVVRGTKALDRVGAGRAEVSLIVMQRRDVALSREGHQISRTA
ncbi:MAG: hypothetical protein AB2794_11595 [Candidatus Thiodiazotropha endolucinida]